MFQYDFTNHQNRYIRITDMPKGYLESIQTTTKEDPFYPCWHIAPNCGLLNDPCGLHQRDGLHHIFYQWFPAGPVHGLKHWYHLTTKDFIHFTDKGIALLPENSFDSHGCYTGMTLNTPEGASVYYTGIEGEAQIPSICIGNFDGEHITGCRKIIGREPSVSTMNFRDPCVFLRDGSYFMLVGAENPGHKGTLLLYSAKEPDCFRLEGNVDLGDYPFGYMLECPNYFEIMGKGILFFSPMGIEGGNRYDFRNVFSVVYAAGEPLDVENRRFSYGNFYEMDKGFDFYAPQTYLDEHGRQILLGWLGNSKSEYPTDKNNWAHMLTLPREITWENDRMVQKPLKELTQLRGEEILLSDGPACPAILPLSECSFEVEGQTSDEFYLEIGNSDGEFVRFSGTAEEYCLDRSHMTHLYAQRFGTRRYAMRLCQKQTIRFLADRSSLEIFADNGKTVFTSRIFLDDISYLKTAGIHGSFYQLSGIDIHRR